MSGARALCTIPLGLYKGQRGLSILVACLTPDLYAILGRIGIVGGSEEYTGAPCFAGISAKQIVSDDVDLSTVSSAQVLDAEDTGEALIHFQV